MIDAIIYVADFPALVAYLDEHYPDLLARDENGDTTQPPVVTGFARTPAVVNGNELMIYARLSESDADIWRGMEGVTILAEAEFVGKGAADTLYQSVFDNADKYAIYSRVYPHDPYEIEDQEIGTITITPPKKFGIMAGA
ncbi:hypothetical protein [Salinicola peritrichatus]|uniref:hypothetical protein n=1 Tax=Salinicola peritrichatus TaxID=1267424 RepID=UPI000DA204F0|nr:hypothetical protein [Salinicola peritrichatus]